MSTIANRKASRLTLKTCPACQGTGYVVYLAYGDSAYSTHRRPCDRCDQLGMSARKVR